MLTERWASFPYELLYPAPVSHRSVSIPDTQRTKSTDPMLIYFTSGTTGEPKMVLHNHSYPLGHIVTARLWQDLHHNDLHFTVADTGWANVHGARSSVNGLKAPVSLSIISPENFRQLKSCPSWKNTRSPRSAAPDHLPDADPCRSGPVRSLILRHCTSAGEPLNPEVIRVWKEGTGLTICEGYGQTETACCVATFPNVDPRPGSMGKPSPGWKIEMHDDHGKPVGDHEEGRLAGSSNPRPPVSLLNISTIPRRTKTFVNGWYYTGDKVCGMMTATSGLSAGTMM